MTAPHRYAARAGLQLGMLAPVGFGPVDPKDANRLVLDWGHNLGACTRPSAQDAWLLEVYGEPVSVAVGSTTVSPTVRADDGRTWDRTQLVELARLCTRPDARWATRVCLRLWREVAAPRWNAWTPAAAVAYSQNSRHDGEVYRFDGWTRIRRDAGSYGGGTWSTKRVPGDPVRGMKSLWLWEFPE